MKSMYYIGIFLLCFCLFSCDDEEPMEPMEEELITTLIYDLEDDQGNTVQLKFEDLDGDGGNDPIITGGTFQEGVTYTGSMSLLNESETPAEDITEEIEEEDDEHQFFFSSTIAGTISYLDADGNGNPLGLSSSIAFSETGDGTLRVILRHEPEKGATNVAQGDITNAGGETDIEVSFPITVE